MAQRSSALEVYFYKTNSGNEPVKEWLKSLPREDMRTIGFDIKTVQYGYPIGMPLTRVLHGTGGLEEVRCNISNNIARVISMLKTIQWCCCMALLKNHKRHLIKN